MHTKNVHLHTSTPRLKERANCSCGAKGLFAALFQLKVNDDNQHFRWQVHSKENTGAANPIGSFTGKKRSVTPSLAVRGATGRLNLVCLAVTMKMY